MKLTAEERQLVFKLLQENSTIGDVKLFLRQHKIHHSAVSWKDLIEDRLIVALDKGELVRDDLIELLRLSEEHGKQHVFLYRCSQEMAKSLLDRPRVEAALQEMGLASISTRPRILDQPRQTTITDVRWEASHALILKVVKQRKRQELVGENSEGEYLVRRYREIRERVVNLFRLSSDGILELRIFSHHNSSDYKSDVSEMWGLAPLVFARVAFSEYSISNAKTNLWNRRVALQDSIRFSDSKMKNSHGVTLSAATGIEETNLADDLGTTKGVEEFLKHDAYCDSHNIWWLSRRNHGKKDDPLPSKDIHVMLTRSINEFVLTSKCSREDYEYVFDQLKGLNGQTA